MIKVLDSRFLLKTVGLILLAIIESNVWSGSIYASFLIMKSLRSNSAISMSSLVFSISLARLSTSLSNTTDDSSLNCLNFSSYWLTKLAVSYVGLQLSSSLIILMRLSYSYCYSYCISLNIATRDGGLTNFMLFISSKNF